MTSIISSKSIAMSLAAAHDVDVKVQYTLANGDIVVGTPAQYAQTLDRVQSFCVADASDLMNDISFS
jgi:hypothetical protein